MSYSIVYLFIIYKTQCLFLKLLNLFQQLLKILHGIKKSENSAVK